MTDDSDHVSRFVDALLENRRPPRFRIDPHEGEILPTAATLRTVAPGADIPDPAFVERLRRQLNQQVEPLEERAPSRRSLLRGLSRRRLLRGFGIPSAAALVGAAAGAVLREAVEQLRDSAGAPELIPSERGAWTAVGPLESLSVGQPSLFTVGAVRGFLIRQSTTDVMAVSAICTHLGCLLAADEQNGRLDCPCHGAAFALDGSPMNADYTTPLPRLRARVVEGTVEVFAV